MSQINIHTTNEFDRMLRRLMRLRGLKTKSDAIRVAVRECLERTTAGARGTDFESWIGLATTVPPNPSPRFESDDAIWGSR
jgi:hypothetical protein